MSERLHHAEWTITGDPADVVGAAVSGPPPPAFTCPCCGAVSQHPADAEFRYCGRCHWYTGDPELGPPHLAGECAARPATPGGTVSG
jgi:hypothetical protein